MGEAVRAGGLNQPVTVLRLEQTGADAWGWVPERSTWARLRLREKRSLFSTAGIGARGAELVMRRQRLPTGTMLDWGGRYLYVTASVPRGRGLIEVSAAVVALSQCRGDASRTPAGAAFPGILTEKYVGHRQVDLHAEVTTDYVLVTPKAITLSPGSWVICDGRFYRVLAPHELDPYKNEYEIRRREDC